MHRLFKCLKFEIRRLGSTRSFGLRSEGRLPRRSLKDRAGLFPFKIQNNLAVKQSLCGSLYAAAKEGEEPRQLQGKN